MKNILIVSQYSAPHAGNYIASLLDLERFSNNKYNCYYVFPIGAKKLYKVYDERIEKK